MTHPNLALKSIPKLLLPSLQASQEGERMACTALFAEVSLEDQGGGLARPRS